MEKFLTVRVLKTGTSVTGNFSVLIRQTVVHNDPALSS